MTPTYDELWSRQRFSMMADGGVWAVPRSGLIFTRRGNRLELTAPMPWTPELAEAAAEGRDVPADAAALRVYQDADFEAIRTRFEAAGIPVHDALDEPDRSESPNAGASDEDLPACPVCGSNEPDCEPGCSAVPPRAATGDGEPYVSAGETSIFPPISKDHPLNLAARETNDYALAHGLEATLEWLGMGGPGELAYLAEQRAIRAVAASIGVPMGDDADVDEAIARTITETDLWREMRVMLLGCYLDGFAIGVRGEQIRQNMQNASQDVPSAGASDE